MNCAEKLLEPTIFFNLYTKSPFHPPLSMNQNLINNVNSHKHLGLTFSQDCSWHDHLELVKTKAWLRINIMRRLNFSLTGSLSRRLNINNL